MSLAIGLDLGTTSICAVAVDLNGNPVGRVTRAHNADLPTSNPRHAEQSPDRLWRTACAVLRELTAELNETPASLGVTGQMHGMLLVNDRLKPLGPLITWKDRRALEGGKSGTSLLEEFRALCDAEAVEKTGCTCSPGYLAISLFTLMRRSQIPGDSRWALLLADWVTARLAGVTPNIDRTNAASTGVYNLADDCWSNLIAATTLPAELFPPVVGSGKIFGELKPEPAAETGLPLGLPVGVAMGDHQAALLGAVPDGASAIHINIGTGGQISLPLDRFTRAAASETRYLPDDRFLLVGAGSVGGDAYASLREWVAAWVAPFGMTPTNEEIYATLQELVSKIPPECDGLTAEPYFRGSRHEPNRRGKFDQISTTNFTPGHLGAAIWDGVAKNLVEFRDAHQSLLAGSNQDFRIVATGNAVRENPRLAESLAREFEAPIWTPEHREEAAFGAALLAGVRAGLWPDLSTASDNIRLVRLA